MLWYQLTLETSNFDEALLGFFVERVVRPADDGDEVLVPGGLPLAVATEDVAVAVVFLLVPRPRVTTFVHSA